MADVTVQYADGTSQVYEGVPDAVTPEQFLARVAKDRPEAQVASVERERSAAGTALDVAKGAGAGLLKGARSLGDLVSGAAGGVNPLLGLAAETIQGPSRQLQESLDFPPQTKPGEYAKSIGEQVLPWAAGGFGRPVLAGVGAVMSGVGGQSFADLFGDNALTRGLGSLAGGLAAPVAASRFQNAKELLATHARHLRPEDYRQAAEAGKTLTDIGAPHLTSQLFDVPTGLPSMAARVLENPRVGPRVLRQLGDAPSAVEAEMATRLGQISPLTSRRDALDALQGGAAEAVKSAEGHARAAYKAALPAPFRYQPAAIKNLYDDLLDLAETKGPTSEAGKSVMKLAGKLRDAEGNWVRDSNAINQLYKEMGQELTRLDDFKALPLLEVKALWKRYTPQFQAARDAYHDVQTTLVEPTKRSLTGQVAQQGGGPQADRVTAKDSMLNLLFPKDAAQPQQLTGLARDLRGTSQSDALAQGLREHLSKALEVTLAPKEGLPNLKGPGEFVSRIYGTNAQQTNLQTALTEIAKQQKLAPRQVVRGYDNLFKALDSYNRLIVPKESSAMEVGRIAERSLPALMVAPFGRTARALEDITRAKTHQQVADLLLSPGGLAKLEQLGKYSPYSTAARLLITDILGAGVAGESGGE